MWVREVREINLTPCTPSMLNQPKCDFNGCLHRFLWFMAGNSSSTVGPATIAATPSLCVTLFHSWLTLVFSGRCRHSLQSERNSRPGSRLPRSWTTACYGGWRGDQLFFCGDARNRDVVILFEQIRLGDISETANPLMCWVSEWWNQNWGDRPRCGKIRSLPSH